MSAMGQKRTLQERQQRLILVCTEGQHGYAGLRGKCWMGHSLPLGGRGSQRSRYPPSLLSGFFDALALYRVLLTQSADRSVGNDD